MNHIARTPKQIGEVIRRRRIEAGYTQTELGRLAGLRQATISQVENGSKAAQIESVCLILAALGLEILITDRSQGSTQDIEAMF